MINRFTCKPIDHSRDALPRESGMTCEHCGAGVILDCLVCGAPVCCPICCAEATAELREKMKKECVE